jgi:hypothetical protein
MNWKKIWSGIKIGLAITEHLSEDGLLPAGKVVTVVGKVDKAVISVDHAISGASKDHGEQ